MRKYSVVVLSILTLASFGLFLSSCKEDEPPVKPKLSFASTEMTVNEGEGTIEIEIVLDKPAPEDIEINYELEGSAMDKVTAGTTYPYDYEIVGDYLTTEIAKGETTGIIEIKLTSDLAVEDDETIEISITDVESEKIEITREDEIEITVEQEDGLFIVLEWGIGEGEDYTDVDMDLFLWWEDELGELIPTYLRTNDGSFYTNLNGGFSSPEYFFVPLAFDDGSYGASFNYYEGSEDVMNFQVTYIELINGALEPVANRSVFNATYSLDNINPWDDETVGADPVLAQTFEKSGSSFTNFSEDIFVGTSGSRLKSSLKIPSDFKRQKNIGAQVTNQKFLKLLNRN